MNNSKISASLMCANLLNLSQDISELEKSQVDFLHVDIMDGSFVPNLTFGIDTVNHIKASTKLPLDIHLLVDKPSLIIRSLNFSENDFITIHAECSERIMENVAYIKQKGAKFGLALNPDTTVDEIQKYLPYIDLINIMLIVPGFAGSTIIHGIMDKVAETRKFLDSRHYENILIEVDGSVSPERAKILKEYGASIFVGGTSSIFNSKGSISENIKTLRTFI